MLLFLLVRETGIGLAAARDALGSDRPPDGHSLPRASIPSIFKAKTKKEHTRCSFFVLVQ